MSLQYKLRFVAVAAAVLAAPGCCVPGFLCGHSSTSQHVVVGGSEEIYYSQSGTCPHCGGITHAGTAAPTPAIAAPAASSVMMPEKPAAGSGLKQQNGFLINQPNVAADSPYGRTGDAFGAPGSGNVMDVIAPSNALRNVQPLTPPVNALPPANVLPGFAP